MFGRNVSLVIPRHPIRDSDTVVLATRIIQDVRANIPQHSAEYYNSCLQSYREYEYVMSEFREGLIINIESDVYHNWCPIVVLIDHFEFNRCRFVGNNSTNTSLIFATPQPCNLKMPWCYANGDIGLADQADRRRYVLLIHDIESDCFDYFQASDQRLKEVGDKLLLDGIIGKIANRYIRSVKYKTMLCIDDNSDEGLAIASQLYLYMQMHKRFRGSVYAVLVSLL